MKKGNVTISSIFKGSKTIDKILKGTLIVYEGWKKLIANGVPPLTLQKCKGVDLVDYKIYGESIQDGTPTPETPIEIESVGDKTSNLFDKEYLSKTENYTINSGGGYFSASIKIKPNTKYTVFSKRTEATDTPESGFYCKVALPTDRVGSISSFAYYIESSDRFATNNKKTVTTGDDGLIYFAVSGNGSQSMLDILFKYYYFQIVEGTTELEYEPYGYKIPVRARGKNIFSFKNATTTRSHTTVDYEILSENSIKLTSNKPITSTSAYINVRVDLDVRDLIGKTFTPSCIWKSTFESAQSKAYYRFYDNDNNALTSNTPFKTFTIPEGAYYLRIVLYLTTGDLMNEGDSITFTDIMVEYGDTKTEFEPYIEPITTNIYLDKPLRKIRDVSDYVDFEQQKVIRNIKQYVFDGTESVSEQSSNFPSDETYLFSIGLSSRIDRVVAGGGWAGNYDLCNYFINANKSLQQTTNNNDEGFVGHGSVSYAGYFYFRLFKSRFTDETTKATQFKNMIKEWYENGNPMILQYVTSSPTEEDIELPNIPLNKGTNIIEIDTNILPSNIEVAYLGKK